MTSKTMILNDETSLAPIMLREGEAVAFVIPVAGVQTSISSPTMYFYQEGQTTDRASTYWTGAMSVSGDTIITKTTQALRAGMWVLSVSATVDGQVQNVCTVPVIIKRRSEL